MLKFSSEDIISFEKIKELWAKNNLPTVLYFHNPFCITYDNCKYCMHKGCPKNDHNSEEVLKYYFEYAYSLFKLYDEIIQSQDIKLINFGGGTPNYLDPTLFDKFCSGLPSWFKEKEKIIELHPALISKVYIDILEKWNFKNLIFCFQTFDEKTLNNQGRLSTLNIEVFKYAKQKGFNLAIDLITCWNDNSEDYKILENDLNIVKSLQPDELTISPLYQTKYSKSQAELFDIYSKIKKLVNKIIPDYENPENTLEELFNVCAIRLFKKDSDIKRVFDIYINSLSDFSWEHNQGYSTLGLGTYKNRDKSVYSIIGGDYIIYEEFNNWLEPKFHLAKNWNFWEAAKNVLSALEEKLGKNPPVGFHIILDNVSQNLSMNNFGGEYDTPFDHFVQGNCKFSLSGRLPICETEEEIEFKKEVDLIDKNFINSYNCEIGEKNE